MLIRKGFLYRLRFKPSVDTSKLRQYAGCTRFVWNKALALQKERLDCGKRCLSYNEMASMLIDWKEKHPFLKEAPSQVLQ